MDHGLGAAGQGLIVAGETAVHHDPSDTPLHYPAPLDDMKAAGFRVSVDDLDVDSKLRPVLNDGVLEAGVDPDLGNGRVGLLGLVEELYSCGVLGQACGGDGYGEE